MRKLFFRGPVLTCSGYGVHAREVLRNLMKFNEFEISVEPISWGSTPYLDEQGEFFDQISLMVARYEQEKSAGFNGYDLSVQVTIPNEFKRYARFNIGVTAGIEVDRASPEWLLKCNNDIDVVVVPSRHSAESLANVSYRSDQGQELRFSKTLAVIPEGFDPEIFNTDPLKEEKFEFDTGFNFLFVGLGLDRPMNEDRKNVTGLVKYFCERFAGEKDVGLILKTSIVGNSEGDRLETLRRIEEIKRSTGCGEFPRIHLIHGRLSDSEMAALYKCNSVKAMVSFTHGEGYGLPLLEAAACGLPIIATNWSGHLDFLTIDNKKKFVPVEYEAREIPPSAVWKGVMEPGSRWAEVKPEDAKHNLRKFFLSSDVPKKWALELAAHLAKSLSPERILGAYKDFFQKFVSDTGTASVGQTDTERASKMRDALGIKKGERSLLFTMPMSAGDVFLSTAVVSELKLKFPDHLIFFATQEKYADIVKGNLNIHRIVMFENWMMNVPFCELVFDEVYTPNLDIQMNSSNWIHRGKGRKLGDEIANRCLVKFGTPSIQLQTYEDLPSKFVALHPGSGKGQWEARSYNHWKEVVQNIRPILKEAGFELVVVGSSDDMTFEGCIDLRGKTTYNQLAFVISKASSLVGIDSVTMHMAAAFGTPSISLFGSSYASSTGPMSDDSKHVTLEPASRYTCEKACYKYQCHVDPENPCINEISPVQVGASVLKSVGCDSLPRWIEYRPKIAGYTHVLNAKGAGYPFIESVSSMLGFCDEVVVVDGGSSDGTLEELNSLAEKDPRLKVMVHEWDWKEPGMDGMQKAYARAMCDVGEDDFLWQQDADEVVHEEDYGKIRSLVKRFPKGVSLMHLPVVELWGDGKTVRTDRHSWKWRLSRNDFRITHGINKHARVTDPKTGRTYSKKGMSDGCEYIDVMTHEFIPHSGFYDKRLELLRNNVPEQYGTAMNKLFNELPSVYHFSWANLPRKIQNFKTFWNSCWSNLYNDPEPVDRFPDVIDELSLERRAAELKAQGGEHGKAPTFELKRTCPASMSGWIARIDDRPVHHNEGSARAAAEVSPLPEELH